MWKQEGVSVFYFSPSFDPVRQRRQTLANCFRAVGGWSESLLRHSANQERGQCSRVGEWKEGRKKGGMNLTNQGEGQVRWAESPIPKCTTCSAGLYRGAENRGQRPGNRQFRGAPTLRKVLLGLFPVVPGVLDSVVALRVGHYKIYIIRVEPISTESRICIKAALQGPAATVGL